jgi:hypothetical protein
LDQESLTRNATIKEFGRLDILVNSAGAAAARMGEEAVKMAARTPRGRPGTPSDIADVSWPRRTCGGLISRQRIETVEP